jgi:hypothetical protein
MQVSVLWEVDSVRWYRRLEIRDQMWGAEPEMAPSKLYHAPEKAMSKSVVAPSGRLGPGTGSWGSTRMLLSVGDACFFGCNSVLLSTSTRKPTSTQRTAIT